MIKSLLRDRFQTILSVIEGSIVIAFWDSIKTLLLPLGSETLAAVTILLTIIIVILITYLTPTIIKYKALKKDILQYNPTHFEDKEYEKLFNEAAKKKKST